MKKTISINQSFLKLTLIAACALTTTQAQLVWTGAVNTNWDTTTQNWDDGGATAFTNGDSVLFNAAATDVTMAESISFGGAGMTVSNGLVRFTGDGANAHHLGGTGRLIINPGAGNAVVFRNFHIDSQTDLSRATFAGGTTVQSGTLQIRANRGAATASAAHAFSFGTGDITLQNGTTLWVNGVSGSTSGTTYLLQNKTIIQGAVTSAPNRGAGSDAGGTNSGNFSLRLGAVDLSGELLHNAGGGGGGANDGPHGISGTITLDQSVANTLALRNSGGGNQGYTISGNIVDGVGGAGNVLRLRTSGETSTFRQFTLSGTGNTYAGGTIIEAAATAATEIHATSGFQRAIVIADGSSLGTGDVTVNLGGLLTLQGDNNINSDAVLTINNRGFLHLDNVNLTFNQFDSVFAWNSTANDLISLNSGTYDVSQLNAFFGNNSNDEATFHGTGSITVIPEPGTLALVGIALGSLLLFRRRR